MTEVYAYLLCSYVFLFTVGAWLLRRVRRALPIGRPIHKAAIVGTSGVLLALPVLPYLYMNVMTALHYGELESAVHRAAGDINGSPTIRFCRVLSITDASARVYLVTPYEENRRCLFRGEILQLQRGNNGWTHDGRFETVWSDSGSADGNIFPPFSAAGDFH